MTDRRRAASACYRCGRRPALASRASWRRLAVRPSGSIRPPDRGQSHRESRARRLLDLHLHQLAADASIRSRLGAEVRAGLVVIGVHTPEFAFEENVDNVRRAVRQMRIEYPVAIDNDY